MKLGKFSLLLFLATSVTALTGQDTSSRDVVIADPIGAIQGHWFGSSGEASSPDPYEMDVSGKKITVSVLRDPKGNPGIASVGSLQAEILSLDQVMDTQDGRTWIRNKARCWSSHANEYIPCIISITVHSTYILAPRNSVTINFPSSTIKLYRASHLAKLKESYSPSFRSWD